VTGLLPDERPPPPPRPDPPVASNTTPRKGDAAHAEAVVRQHREALDHLLATANDRPITAELLCEVRRSRVSGDD
jgi:hypothetical protein